MDDDLQDYVLVKFVEGEPQDTRDLIEQCPRCGWKKDALLDPSDVDTAWRFIKSLDGDAVLKRSNAGSWYVSSAISLYDGRGILGYAGHADTADQAVLNVFEAMRTLEYDGEQYKAVCLRDHKKDLHRHYEWTGAGFDLVEVLEDEKDA